MEDLILSMDRSKIVELEFTILSGWAILKTTQCPHSIVKIYRNWVAARMQSLLLVQSTFHHALGDRLEEPKWTADD